MVGETPDTSRITLKLYAVFVLAGTFVMVNVKLDPPLLGTAYIRLPDVHEVEMTPPTIGLGE